MVAPPIDPYFLASTSYSGRIPTASHEKSSLWVQGYIASFSHARGRAPLNVHAAPTFLGHLGLEIQKMKQIKFESLKSNKSKIEACRESFPGIFNHPWTSRIVVSKVSKKFQI